jgi:hypothetical protein
LIEKPYGRPAIGDVVGYMSKPDLPSEDLRMLVKIEGTTIEIPVDPSETESLREQNPPGSQITLWFYNCGWHVEGKLTTQESKPRIGISISELLSGHGKPAADIGQVTFDVGPALDHGIVLDEPTEEDARMAASYINEVELEFKDEAAAVLKSIKLSHLQVNAHGKMH